MKFVASISNDDVAALEAVHFDGCIEVVETPDALAKACHILSKERIIGFDTETRPSFQAGVSHKVSLLQLSTATHCLPLVTPGRFSAFAPFRPEI